MKIMKKLTAFLLALTLFLSLSVNAFALDLTVTQQGEIAKGETVTFEVRLTEGINVKSGSICIDFDPEIMTVQSYTWHLDNPVLQHFDTKTGKGVFAYSKIINIGDLIFSVTFKVADDAEYGDASVDVNMGFKDNENPENDVVTEDFVGDAYISCGSHVPGPEATPLTDQVCLVCQYVLVPATGLTVSGTVTSFLSDTEDVTVELWADGAKEASHSVTVRGKSANYAIDGVIPGTYTMKVSKANHVTREYTVTLTEDVTQDAKIHLKGDINGDGKANAVDKRMIYNHMNDSTKKLTGYSLLAADISGDGKVNAVDKRMIYNHMNDASKKLW